MGSIKHRIKNYWNKRSRSFCEDRNRDLCGKAHQVWDEEIAKYIPHDKKLKILDVGTGSGFFAILLAQKGHEVIGIDLSEEMLKMARGLSLERNLDITFLQMDSEALDFFDESFDVIISRNVMWTLENPKKAYEEWMRVLKKDGILLHFDANHGKVHYAPIAENERGHSALDVLDMDMLKECDHISDLVPLSKMDRPQWDKEILASFLPKLIDIDLHAGENLYEVEFAKTFRIYVRK